MLFIRVIALDHHLRTHSDLEYKTTILCVGSDFDRLTTYLSDYISVTAIELGFFLSRLLLPFPTPYHFWHIAGLIFLFSVFSNGSYYVVPSVHPSVRSSRFSVCLSVHPLTFCVRSITQISFKIFWKSCPLYNFQTIKNIFMELNTNIKLNQTMCRE